MADAKATACARSAQIDLFVGETAICKWCGEKFEVFGKRGPRRQHCESCTPEARKRAATRLRKAGIVASRKKEGKRCSSCLKILPLEKFWLKCGASRDGHEGRCGTCMASRARAMRSKPEQQQKRREYFQHNREHYRASRRARHRRDDWLMSSARAKRLECNRAVRAKNKAAGLTLKGKPRKPGQIYRPFAAVILTEFGRGLSRHARKDQQDKRKGLPCLNAIQAWQWWMNVKATSAWLDAYWSAHPKPWLDHRLTDAEQYRLRYKVDQQFRKDECRRMSVRRHSRPDLQARWERDKRGRWFRAAQSADGTVTREFIRALLNETHCAYCHQLVIRRDRHVEHVYPLAHGGEHSATNIVMSCASCNRRKRHKLPLQWLLELLIKNARVPSENLKQARVADSRGLSRFIMPLA